MFEDGRTNRSTRIRFNPEVATIHADDKITMKPINETDSDYHFTDKSVPLSIIHSKLSIETIDSFSSNAVDDHNIANKKSMPKVETVGGAKSMSTWKSPRAVLRHVGRSPWQHQSHRTSYRIKTYLKPDFPNHTSFWSNTTFLYYLEYEHPIQDQYNSTAFRQTFFSSDCKSLPCPPFPAFDAPNRLTQTSIT